jgi:hypothetical protein
MLGSKSSSVFHFHTLRIGGEDRMKGKEGPRLYIVSRRKNPQRRQRTWQDIRKYIHSPIFEEAVKVRAKKRLSQRKGELMNQGSIMVKLLEHADTRLELATQLALRKLRVRLTKKEGGPHGEGKETR